VKNLELAHYVDPLQYENDDLKKLMGWLLGHKPQLNMMIAEFKYFDGQALGSEKVGECSGERSLSQHKQLSRTHFHLSPTISETNLTQPQIL
jgi:hypothetical protein